MAKRRIPPDAYYYYVGLGPNRSYQQVAEHFGVSKRSVTRLAVQERWQEQVDELEAKAQESAREKARSELEEAYERHMKALRLVFGRGIEALRSMAIDNPADALRAIRMAIQEERVALGEPTDRTAVSIEGTIRREMDRWLVRGEGGDE